MVFDRQTQLGLIHGILSAPDEDAPRLGYADWLDRPGRFRSVGDGQIDFGGIFDRLTQYGYDGWAVLEWECCLKNAMDGAAEGARFIADHIIRIAEQPFDASMRQDGSPEALDRILGLKRP